MVFKRSKMFICYTMAIYSIFFINEYIPEPSLIYDYYYSTYHLQIYSILSCLITYPFDSLWILLDIASPLPLVLIIASFQSM